jgi:hypothetical protein
LLLFSRKSLAFKPFTLSFLESDSFTFLFKFVFTGSGPLKFSFFGTFILSLTTTFTLSLTTLFLGRQLTQLTHVHLTWKLSVQHPPCNSKESCERQRGIAMPAMTFAATTHPSRSQWKWKQRSWNSWVQNSQHSFTINNRSNSMCP